MVTSDQERQKWDRIYTEMPLSEEDEATKSFHREFLATVSQFLPAGSKTLEAGAGGGGQSVALARSGNYQATLFDISPKALQYSARIFEREKLPAEFREGNILDPGSPEFDLVFNAGVLEHYTFEEQAAFVRGMASRSTRYVLVLVPNRQCYWYWLWRIQKTGQGTWPFGKEVPVIDLSAVFKEAGLVFIGQKYLGADWTEALIGYIDGIGEDFRRQLLEVHRSPFIPAAQKSYLLAGLGCVSTEKCSTLDGWQQPGHLETLKSAELFSALADSLALKVGTENKLSGLQKRLDERDNQLGELEKQLDELNKKLDENEKANALERAKNLEAQKQILELQQSLARRNEEVLEYGQQVSELSQSISTQKNELESLKNEVISLQRDRSTLAEITASRSWRLIRTLWRLRLAVAPSNSWVERQLGWGAPVKPAEQDVHADSAELEAILARHKDASRVIVFPPSVEWNLHLFQRPQQMAMAYALQNCLVFYCDPNYSSAAPGFHKIKDNLFGFKGDMGIFKTIPRPTVVVFSYNKEWIANFQQPQVVYEYIDELSVFQRDLKKLKNDHDMLLETADVVIATARRLLEQVQPARPDAILCPNGVDFDHFHKAAMENPSIPAPNDMLPILAEGKPVIGYYGALARWFDYRLVKETAEHCPDWNFVLIGPDFDGSIFTSGVLEKENIHWLGVRDYAVLPGYLKCFDVATIPFQVNEITHSTSPLKLFEYMAGGKPVVITPMQESLHTGGVLVADGVEEFIQKIKEGLSLRKDPGYLELLERTALENTWQKRAGLILDHLTSNNSKET